MDEEIGHIPLGQLLGAKDAAAYVGMSYSHFRRVMASGGLRSGLRGGRRYFLPEWLDEFQQGRPPRGRRRRLTGKWAEYRRQASRASYERRKAQPTPVQSSPDSD